MLEDIRQLARQAGDAILQIYNDEKQTQIRHKSDNSPVTKADLDANKVILAGLEQMYPDIPVLSEESLVDWSLRQHWQRYWLVDPLDGTKEFILRNGQFTVNIALIDKGRVIAGVVYAPVLNQLWFASEGQAFREEESGPQPIKVQTAYPPVVVVSRSQAETNDELKDYLQQLGPHQTINIGSSLKFCLIAEGKAQLYPRFGPTNIWDTAAGQAVAEAAGAHVTDWHGKVLDYTPRISFLNPFFRVSLF